MKHDYEGGESLVCSLCKMVIVYFPYKHTEDYIKSAYQEHILTCGGIPPEHTTNEDIKF